MLQIIKLTVNGKPCDIAGVIAHENARRALEAAWTEAGGVV